MNYSSMIPLFKPIMAACVPWLAPNLDRTRLLTVSSVIERDFGLCQSRNRTNRDELLRSIDVLLSVFSRRRFRPIVNLSPGSTFSGAPDYLPAGIKSRCARSERKTAESESTFLAMAAGLNTPTSLPLPSALTTGNKSMSSRRSATIPPFRG
jgi:hypothetical protein